MHMNSKWFWQHEQVYVQARYYFSVEGGDNHKVSPWDDSLLVIDSLLERKSELSLMVWILVEPKELKDEKVLGIDRMWEEEEIVVFKVVVSLVCQLYFIAWLHTQEYMDSMWNSIDLK